MRIPLQEGFFFAHGKTNGNRSAPTRIRKGAIRGNAGGMPPDAERAREKDRRRANPEPNGSPPVFCRGRYTNQIYRRCRQMANDARVKITLACTECKQRNYDTKKNKKNDPDRLELMKYCKFCRKHTLHKETK